MMPKFKNSKNRIIAGIIRTLITSDYVNKLCYVLLLWIVDISLVLFIALNIKYAVYLFSQVTTWNICSHINTILTCIFILCNIVCGIYIWTGFTESLLVCTIMFVLKKGRAILYVGNYYKNFSCAPSYVETNEGPLNPKKPYYYDSRWFEGAEQKQQVLNSQNFKWEPLPKSLYYDSKDYYYVAQKVGKVFSYLPQWNNYRNPFKCKFEGILQYFYKYILFTYQRVFNLFCCIVLLEVNNPLLGSDDNEETEISPFWVKNWFTIYEIWPNLFFSYNSIRSLPNSYMSTDYVWNFKLRNRFILIIWLLIWIYALKSIFMYFLFFMVAYSSNPGVCHISRFGIRSGSILNPSSTYIFNKNYIPCYNHHHSLYTGKSALSHNGVNVGPHFFGRIESKDTNLLELGGNVDDEFHFTTSDSKKDPKNNNSILYKGVRVPNRLDGEPKLQYLVDHQDKINGIIQNSRIIVIP